MTLLLVTELRDMLDNLARGYSDNPTTQISFSLIPFVGNATDTILLNIAARQERSRMLQTLEAMNSRIDDMAELSIDMYSEEFTDYVLDILNKARRARVKEKTNRFAQAFANQCARAGSWDEAFMVNRLIDELDEIHAAILNEVVTAEPQQVGPSEDLVKIVAIDTHDTEGVHDLIALLPEYSRDAITLGCSDVVARGLLRDEGSNRAGRYNMEWFTPSSLTLWFIDKITKETDHGKTGSE